MTNWVVDWGKDSSCPPVIGLWDLTLTYSDSCSSPRLGLLPSQASSHHLQSPAHHYQDFPLAPRSSLKVKQWEIHHLTLQKSGQKADASCGLPIPPLPLKFSFSASSVGQHCLQVNSRTAPSLIFPLSQKFSGVTLTVLDWPCGPWWI